MKPPVNLFLYVAILSALLMSSCGAPAPTASPTPTLELTSTATESPTMAPAPAPAATATPPAMDAAKLAELDAFVRSAMELAGVPGAAIAIVQNGQVIHTQGFGVREIGKHEPVTADTWMMIGSTTKSLTGLMMATLVDDQVVSWETPLASLYPAFSLSDPDLTQKLTLRHTLCACAGLPRKDYEAWFTAAEMTPETVIGVLQTLKPSSELGQQFSYNNHLVAAGGYIAPLAAGASSENLAEGYISAMQTRVFDPVGMRQTTFSFDAVVASGNLAAPHLQNLQGAFQSFDPALEEHLLPVMPAGAVWSTANDMARYLVTLLSGGVAPDGNRVVSEKNLTFTWTPQVRLSGTASYGLGWIIDQYQKQPLISHGGNTSGYTTELAFLPEAGLGIVILTNAGYANPFVEAVRTRFLELALRLPAYSDAAFRRNLADWQEPVNDLLESLQPNYDLAPLASYQGTFVNDILGKITLEADGDRLVVDAGEFRGALAQMGTDGLHFIVGEPPMLTLGINFEFDLDDKGNPTIVTQSQTETYVFTRQDAQ